MKTITMFRKYICICVLAESVNTVCSLSIHTQYVNANAVFIVFGNLFKSFFNVHYNCQLAAAAPIEVMLTQAMCAGQ